MVNTARISHAVSPAPNSSGNASATPACAVCATADHPQLQLRGHQCRCARPCTDCIRKHANAQIWHFRRAGVPCMDPACHVSISDSDLGRAGTPAADLAELDELRLLAYLSKQPNWVRCASGCGSGALVEAGEFMSCPRCGARTCVRHRVVFHDGQTCQQYDEAQRARAAHVSIELGVDIDAEVRALPYIRQCPRCRTGIVRKDGCDKMTCQVDDPRAAANGHGCGHRFCYACLADYDLVLQDTNNHAPTCRLHPGYAARRAGPARAPAPATAAATDQGCSLLRVAARHPCFTCYICAIAAMCLVVVVVPVVLLRT